MPYIFQWWQEGVWLWHINVTRRKFLVKFTSCGGDSLTCSKGENQSDTTIVLLENKIRTKKWHKWVSQKI